MFYEGQIITKKQHPAFANWNRINGNKLRSEPCEGGYILVAYVVPEPTVEEQNKHIAETRERLYEDLVDRLHAQKQRKTILGEWSPELEDEYIAEVKRLSAMIQEDNPYVIE